MINIDPLHIVNALPAHLRTSWAELSQGTIQSSDDLTACLLGAFSVGKSTLINMLLKVDLLPTGLQETTGIPTFITYGDKLVLGHAADDSTWREVEKEEFYSLCVTPGTPGSFTTVSIPMNWLKGHQLVDLPGVSGNEDTRKAYTQAQIATADVILYMIEPRGPTREDLYYLSYARLLGKHIRILVTQWDRVQSAVASGETGVNLERWQNQINEAIGLDIPLLPVSIDGHGRDELIKFLSSLTAQRDTIRQKRFRSEALPLLVSALDVLKDEAQAINATSQQERQRLESEIRERRRQLLEIKSQVSAQREQQRSQIDQQFTTEIDTLRAEIQDELEKHHNSLLAQADQQSWQIFLHEVNQLGDRSLVQAASIIKDLHSDAIDIQKLKTTWQGVHFQFPAQDNLDLNDWLESARVRQLEEQFLTLIAEIEHNQQLIPAHLPPDQRDELIVQIRDLRLTHDNIASAELRTIERLIEGDKIGSTIGNAIGNIADIGLLFIQPHTAITKISSFIGKGASALPILKNAADGLNASSKYLPAVAKANRHLGMLSISHWTEKIGSMFDTPDRIVHDVDPEALAERDAALRQTEQHIHALSEQLYKLEDAIGQGEHATYMLELKHKEKQRVEAELEREKQKAEQQAQQNLELERQRIQKRIQHEADKACRRTLDAFNSAVRGMERQLNQAFKQFWETRFDEALAEHETHLQNLLDMLKQVPEDHQNLLQTLAQRQKTLELATQRLRIDESN